MNIKVYHPKHKEQCIAIFKSNMPLYFMDKELPLFEKWLDEKGLDGQYFVIEEAEKLLACGGYFYHDVIKKHGLSWGMVDAKLHGQGIGRILTKYRVEKMIEKFPNAEYMIETSQHTFKFYQKMGFVTKKITPNGFGEGLDNYYMELEA